MLSGNTFVRGFRSGFNVCLQLIKVMVPIYVVVIYLKHTGILEVMSRWLAPAMNIFGLPGEAAYAIILGNTLNLYAAVGAMSAIDLSTKQVTIIAAMLVICHNIFVESAVIKGCNIRVGPFVLVRIGFAVAAGLLLNFIM